MNCPCQSGLPYQNCCADYISGAALPASPEQLMRSRYSAYALGALEYIRDTWHPDFRPSQLTPDPGLRWIGLQIVNAAPASAAQASVEFEARFLLDGRVDGLHEHSEFLSDAGRWLYTRGDPLPLSFAPWKPGRNELCPCGSGQKFKRCCGR